MVTTRMTRRSFLAAALIAAAGAGRAGAAWKPGELVVKVTRRPYWLGHYFVFELVPVKDLGPGEFFAPRPEARFLVLTADTPLWRVPPLKSWRDGVRPPRPASWDEFYEADDAH